MADVTDGPWEYVRGSIVGAQAFAHADPSMNRYSIAKVVRHEAAALIAAAPDLLESVRAAESLLVVMFSRWPDGGIPETVPTPLGPPVKLGDIVRDLRASIAKAEGLS